MTPRYLTPAEVAGQLRVDVFTVRRWITRGQLGAYRVGQRYLIDPGAVDAFLAARRVPAGS